uniref:Uncharacterized protein n=1 Tax=Knipowitschia caucasica TaxID=637954 RepID=A0AAV2JUA3_KNICA
MVVAVPLLNVRESHGLHLRLRPLPLDTYLSLSKQDQATTSGCFYTQPGSRQGRTLHQRNAPSTVTGPWP